MHYKINHHSYFLSWCLYVSAKKLFAGLSNAFSDPDSCYENIARSKKEIDWAYVRDEMQGSKKSPRESKEKIAWNIFRGIFRRLKTTNNLFVFCWKIFKNKHIWHDMPWCCIEILIMKNEFLCILWQAFVLMILRE